MLMASVLAARAQDASGEDCPTVRLTGLEGTIDGSGSKCKRWEINPGQPLAGIIFNVTYSRLETGESLYLYGSMEASPTELLAVFTPTLRPLRVGAQVLWGYDQTLLVLRANNENTAFLMKYAARPERGITAHTSTRISPAWLAIWLIIWFILISACCSALCCVARRRRRMAIVARGGVPLAELSDPRSRAEREENEQKVGTELQALPVTSWDVGRADTAIEEGLPECCLCMDALKVGDEIRTLPCEHFFRKDCIDRWFASQAYRTRTCPLCKTDPVAPTTPTATAAESTAADQASSEREAVPPEAPDETPRTLDLPVDAATQSAVGRR